MNKLLLSTMVTIFVLSTNAQSTQTTMTAQPVKKEAGKPVLKDHVCTAACKDGKQVYAHGEKGHVCTAACKK
jgi:hypothetical protein